MPTTAGPQVRTPADIVRTLTNCSKAEADAVEKLLCSNRGRFQKLATLCGISTVSVGFGFRLIAGGGTAPEGILLAGAGLYGAKKYCSALVGEVNGVIKNAAAAGE